MTHDDVVASIIDVSLRSAKAKEICIFEIGNLGDLISPEEAEKVRSEFVRHNTPIRQITNHRRLAAWTSNEELTQNLRVTYVPVETLAITDEILIFDATVAVYRLHPDPFYHEVSDWNFAQMMRQSFEQAWALGDSLLLSKDGSTSTKQYLPITTHLGGVPAVIYPAKDDGNLEVAFSRTDLGCLERYAGSVIKEHQEYYEDADMLIVIIWNQAQVPCCDIWKVMRNHYSDDSGFLYDVRVYREREAITDMGVASGNTSIVLAAEELLLRELILKAGLSFAEASDRTVYQARFPIGYVPAEAFYLAAKA